MKQGFKSLCVSLAMILSVAAFSSCDIINGLLGNQTGISSSEESSKNSSTSETPVEPEEPKEPVDPPKSEEEIMRDEAYAYYPEMPSNMPRIIIRSEDNNHFATAYTSSDGVDYTDCTVSISNCDEEYEMTDVEAGIRVRGNATVTYPKKPFRIKFSKKQSMLGLNDGAKCKSWVLLAEYKDSSFLRNSVAFYLGNTILGSDGLYCTEFRPVELYLNGEYWGVYLLAEQQQINENRVDIPEPEEDYEGTDIGYLIEYDGYYYKEKELEQFSINYNNKAPVQKLDGGYISITQMGFAIKSDVYSQAQKDYIASYTENAYRVMYEAAYNNKFYEFNEGYTALVESDATSAKEAISRTVNLDSLVDTYILNEICCDYDIDWSSFYLSVDLSANGDGKLNFQAPWDFDSSLGLKPDGLDKGKGMFVANSDNPWLTVLIRQEWFMDMVKEKWAEMVEYDLLKNALGLIGDFEQTYSSYYELSFDRWGNIGIDLPDHPVAEVVNCKTHADAANYLHAWLYARLNYLNTQFGDGTDVLTGGEQENITFPDPSLPDVEDPEFQAAFENKNQLIPFAPNKAIANCECGITDSDKITTEYVTLEDGAKATRFNVGAGAVKGSGVSLSNHTTPAEVGKNGFSCGIAQQPGVSTAVLLHVKNNGATPISFRYHAVNYNVDEGGVNITLAAGESKDVFMFLKNSSGTVGVNHQFALLSDVIADTSVTVWGEYLATELTDINIATAAEKLAYTVGERFSSKGLVLKADGSNYERVYVAFNYVTDLDGYVFTAEDVGVKTVTVTFAGKTTTYEIVVE